MYIVCVSIGFCQSSIYIGVETSYKHLLYCILQYWCKEKVLDVFVGNILVLLKKKCLIEMFNIGTSCDALNLPFKNLRVV